MSADEEKSDELDPLEAQLAALRPRSDQLDRDRLMFLAGRASAARAAASPLQSIRFWRVVAGAMTAISAALFVALVCRPAPPTVQIVQTPGATGAAKADSPDFAGANTGPVPGPTAQDSISPPRADDLLSTVVFGGLPSARISPPLGPQSSAFLRLRAAALAGGLDSKSGLEFDGPRHGTLGAPPVSNRQLLDSLLEEPAAGWPPHRSSMNTRFQGAQS